MALNLDAVGTAGAPRTVDWGPDDAMLYALGVGAGQDDPLAELGVTTENSRGIDQVVLPTFGVVLTQFRGAGRLDIGSFDPAMLVHAGQSIRLAGPLPAAGRLEVTSRVVGMYDKGSGALVETEAVGVVPGTSAPLVTTRSSVFIRGEGGFGIGGPREDWSRPERDPDRTIPAFTRPDQALLYRLSGDHNPLHTDPAFAARAGFPRPILHGMCTYGVVGRVLLRALAGEDVARFESMSGRFSRPVFPGDELAVHVWEEPDGSLFQVVGPTGDVVIDRGRMSLTEQR